MTTEDTVSVELAHPVDGKAPGDRLDVSPARAKLLIRSGKARPATKTDAKAAGVDPETAATARRASS